MQSLCLQSRSNGRERNASWRASPADRAAQPIWDNGAEVIKGAAPGPDALRRAPPTPSRAIGRISPAARNMRDPAGGEQGAAIGAAADARYIVPRLS
jgi:hypothetical protein